MTARKILIIGVVVGALIGFVCGMLFVAWLDHYFFEKQFLPPEHWRKKEKEREPPKMTLLDPLRKDFSCCSESNA